MQETTTVLDAEAEVPSLRIQRQFNAPREAVFAALTRPEELMQWWGPEGVTTPAAEIDLRPGGRYRFEMRGSEGGQYAVGGVYREIDPPTRLVFTWIWEMVDIDIAGVETLVTIELAERDGGTELTLTHEGIRDAEHRERHNVGWNGGFDCLEKHLQSA